MKILSVFLWVSLLLLPACQPDREERAVAFSTYLEQERLWAEAETLYAAEKWELARTQYARVFLVEREAQAWAQQAACLLHREKRKEAEKTMAAAFLAGAAPEAFSDPVFSPLRIVVDSLNREIHPLYVSTLDTSLRAKVRQILEEGPAFFPELEEFVKVYGWPDCWLIGCGEGLQRRLAVRITEGKEAGNRRFLSLVVEAARRNRESWATARILMQSLCENYLEENQSRLRLWELHLTQDGRLDLENSLLQLFSLAEVYKDKLVYVELYRPQFPGETSPAASISVLEKIREYLISEGMDPLLVGINPYPVEEAGEGYAVGMTVAL